MWVETNRQLVHEATGGRVGYVFTSPIWEWLRGSSTASTCGSRPGRPHRRCTIQPRWYVSQLLCWRSFCLQARGLRHSPLGKPDPYPSYPPPDRRWRRIKPAPSGFGDIFSHVFKMKGWPFDRKGTWAAWGRYLAPSPLAETAPLPPQPEFVWFQDVGGGRREFRNGAGHRYRHHNTAGLRTHGRDPQMEKGAGGHHSGRS